MKYKTRVGFCVNWFNLSHRFEGQRETTTIKQLLKYLVGITVQNRTNVYCSHELHVYCTVFLNNTKQMQYKNNKERFNRKKHQSRK